MDEDQRHGGEPGRLGQKVHADDEQERGHDAHQRAQNGHIGAAKNDGGGLDAHFQVVAPIGHGVFGVEDDGPDKIGGKQPPGQLRNGAGFGRKGHGDSPAERGSQHQLGEMGKALEEGVGGGQQGTEKRQHDGQLVGEQHQHECGGQQDEEQDKGLSRGNFTGGQRAVEGALDLRVEIAVGKVVDDAAGGAHDDDAGGKNKQVPERRKAAGGKPQPPPGGPQQQCDAYGPVKAPKAQPGAGLAGENAGAEAKS